jgi:thiosulfate/3-mercaptopyruvate sulfurtransferase
MNRPAAAARVALTALLSSLPLSGALGQGTRAPALISTAELAGRLTEKAPAVIDVRQAWTNYLESHLPGASWLAIETLRATRGGLPFQLLTGEQYAAIFGGLGLTPGTPIVVYSAGDQLDVDATFVVWLLASAGARDVRLLDGGFAKWQLEAKPLVTDYPRVGPGGAFDPAAFDAAVAPLEAVIAATKGAGAMLVDARSPEQFAGSAGAQRRRGHIPGAVNHYWKDDLEKPDFSLVWKAPEALRVSYQAQGITPERDIIVYCNTGTEASHVYFALRYLLGYPRVRVYAGSWTEWAERGELPIER